jgi:hypothetical protein
MIGKKINQLATELAPASTDLTIIGNPTTGVSKKITLAQLGAIFSGAVSFYTNLAAFPTPGTTDVIYCAKDTQKLYLWSGSAYVEVFPSQALLDTYQLRSEKGNANGYASLDSGGKVPISQLPSSIMEYKGTWNASTNTPTLANGTGDTGDVYICNVAGTVNFGAGAITFAVGDYVIYSGTIWQRSSGAVGTVTSVALTVGGDAISVSGSPLTTSGTLALAFSGTTSQYIRGNGTLANFPTSLVTGSGTTNFVSKFTTSSTIGSSQIYDDGTSVLIGTTGTLPNIKVGIYSSTQRALEIVSTNANALFVQSPAAFIMSISNGTWITQFTNTGRLDLAGDLLVNTIANATTDTDRFLVSDSGVIKYRTGAELLSDIGGASASGYVPYTGATANLDLGTHTLIAAKGTFSSSGSGDTVGITHSSGSGIALNITKGGNGEGLYINKTSGSGNAATIIGTLNATTLVKSGGTSSEFLKADGSVDSTAYGTGSVTSVGLSSATSGVTIGSTPITTSGTITLAIATASGSQQGLLSSTDWTTFNNKQNALTNPVTGTGTTNYLPKFTGTSTIGNSIVFDDGSVGIGTTSATAINNASGLANLVVGNGGGSTQGITIYTNSSTWGGLNFADATSGAGAYAGYIKFDHTNDSMGFFIGNTQRLLINASGNLSIGNTNDTYKLDVTGIGRFSGLISGYSYLYGLQFYKVGLQGASGYLRWDLETTGTESGSNAGSDLILYRYDDSGNYLGTAYSINRSSGAATFSSSVTANNFIASGGNNTTILNSSSATTGWVQVAMNNTTGSALLGIESSVAGTLSTGSTAYATIVRNYTNTDLQLATNNIVRQTITSGGSVGIGTTAPACKLHIEAPTASYGQFRIINTSTDGEASIHYGRTGQTLEQRWTVGQGVAGIDTSFGFYTGGSPKVVLTTGGSVGIGTTSPTAKLQITSTSSGAATVAAFLLNESVSTNTEVRLAFAANTNNDIATNRYSYISALNTSGSNGQALLFATNETGNSAVERMRITSGGLIFMNNLGGYSGSYADVRYDTSSKELFYQTSSLRYKEDINNLENTLSKINQLRAVRYKDIKTQKYNCGFIAEEVINIIPEVVFKKEVDGELKTEGINYSDFTPFIIKALQEQQAQIEELKSQLNK